MIEERERSVSPPDGIGGGSHLWTNGRLIAEEDFRIAAADRILLHGLGLFETLLAIDGRPAFLGRHLARLGDGCRRLGWTLETAGLRDAMCDLLESECLTRGRARIRLTMSAGSGRLGVLAAGKDRLLWLSAAALDEWPGGLGLCEVPFPRNERSALAGLKCASYAENLIALDCARRGGFDEALIYNTAGQLCEAATANVFLVVHGRLLTPPLESGCLPGIARAVVLELAASLGIPTCESALMRSDLMEAAEVFLTSSVRGPVAVTRVGEQRYDAGEITVALHRAWNDLARQDAAG
jgi:branched-subunit amino acid aminotransferase/4-amino-4-deoxychorismate lyase